MIFTGARDFARALGGLLTAPLVILTVTALLPGVGVVVAGLFWVTVAGWTVAVLAPAAGRAAPLIRGVARLLARLAPCVRRARRSWWVRVRVAVARLHLWTGNGTRDRRWSAPCALGAGRGASRRAEAKVELLP